MKKRLYWCLFSLLLCLACLLPAAAADGETPAPDPAQTTETEVTLIDPSTLDAQAWNEWNGSLQGKYHHWKASGVAMYGDRARYDKAFRQFYAIDPEITIVNHMVFCQTKDSYWQSKTQAYYLIDYFDTDEAEATATTLRIPKEINGLPVVIYLYGESDGSSGLYYAGYSNDTVTKVILEDGWTGVPMYAFMNFTALKTVELPSTVKSVGISAFQGCKNLKKIVGGENITATYSSAFAGCEKLATFPNMENLACIEGSAFYGCAFKNLTLSGSVSLSGGDEDHYSAQSAFGNNKKLKTVTFTDGAAKKNLWIGMATFQDCTALKTVTLPKVCAQIDIDDSAFCGCTALNAIYNKDKVTYIGRFAFMNCTSLKSFVVPAGIRTICYDAFKGCKNLKKMSIRSTDPELLNHTFDPNTIYTGDNAASYTTNFVKLLPKTCTIYVKNLDMKEEVKAHGFRGTVKIRVSVAAPAKLKVAKSGSSVKLSWSKVKKATGYRVYLYNEKTDAYTKLKTVKAPTTSVTLQTNGKAFAVRAYRTIDGDVSWSAYTK